MITKKFTTTPVKPRGSARYIRRAVKKVAIPSATYTSVEPVYQSTEPQYQSRPIVFADPAKQTAIPAKTRVKRAAVRIKSSTKPDQPAKVVKPAVYHPHRKLALLLPGHNEELIIATTIHSAIAAGQNKRDIFVVDDGSSDDTRKLAIELLGKQNVLSVDHLGKAMAVQRAVKKFHIEHDYQWLHIADADSVFCPDYFRIYRRKLDAKKYAVAVGFVQSLRGNWISTYRALTYTYSQHVNRRIQSHLGMISVFPGPITCFRTDILQHLEFDVATVTEDFDITLQVHRKKLGKILFIPKAINYTQDPLTLRDFCKQTQRWQRGFFQGVRKYQIGLRTQRIDFSLGFQMLQTIIFLIQLSILLPLIIWDTHNWMTIPVAIAADFILNSAIALWASVAAKRWMMLGALPYFYFLRWAEIVIYLTAFFEVIVLRRFNESTKGWSTTGRRYKLDLTALSDVAK